MLEGRRYASRLKLSGLPCHTTFDDFELAFQPDLDPRRVAERRAALTGLPRAPRRRAAPRADQLGSLRTKLSHYWRSHLLIVDELGYLPLEREDASRVFQLVNRRYERASTVVTSNKSVAAWTSLFGDEALAAAILDSLLHEAEVLTINGPSSRLRGRLEELRGGDAAGS